MRALPREPNPLYPLSIGAGFFVDAKYKEPAKVETMSTYNGWTETEEQTRARWARHGLIVATPDNAKDLEAAKERDAFMARLEKLSNYVDATIDEMERGN
jgi:hypothetical protein